MQAYKILRNLTEIDLSSKNLKSVPEWVEQLTSAKKIDLSFNQINVLPFFLTQMTNLKELRLDGNPLESIPTEVKEGGLKRLMVYLRQLEVSRVKWNRVKLMFVGKEAVGKTTLLRAFRKHLGISAKSALSPRKQSGALLKGFGRKV
jgi:Leucine-rich repeat (LRR) protein